MGEPLGHGQGKEGETWGRFAGLVFNQDLPTDVSAPSGTGRSGVED